MSWPDQSTSQIKHHHFDIRVLHEQSIFNSVNGHSTCQARWYTCNSHDTLLVCQHMYRYHIGLMGKTLTSLSQSKPRHHTCVYLQCPSMYQSPLPFIQLAWLLRQKWLKMVPHMTYIGYLWSCDLPSMHTVWVPMWFLFTYWLRKHFWWLTEHLDHMVSVYISLFIQASYFQPIRSHQLSTQLMVLMGALCIPRWCSSVTFEQATSIYGKLLSCTSIVSIASTAD